LLWETYRDQYYSFQLALSQARVISIAGAQLLSDFPKGLPAHIRSPLVSGLKRIVEAFEAAASDEAVDRLDPADLPGLSSLAWPSLQMFLSRSRLSGEKANPADVQQWTSDFERLLLSQEIVMLFAHLEALLADTVRAIGRTRPETLKSRKRQIDSETVLSCNTFDDVVDLITEKVVRDMEGSISDQLDKLREIGLTMDYPEDALRLLDDLLYLRHTIVHNGGRADQAYLTRAKRYELVIGEFIPIDAKVVDVGSSEGLALGNAVYRETSLKFFGKKDVIVFSRPSASGEH
jgi:hypothetical protein